MLVKDHVFRKPVTIDTDEPIFKAIQLIFNHRVSLLPVTSNRVLVGVVAEKDILKKLLPSMKEFIEASSISESLDTIEKKLPDFMHQPVRMIMNDEPYSVTLDTPLLKAQSMMLRKNFHIAPIVNDQNQVIGVISQGDIFKAIAGKAVLNENDQFHEWYARFYNLIEPTQEKEGPEIEALDKLFRAHDSYRILDIFCGSGGHANALASKSYEVLGLNKYKHFHEAALEKAQETFSRKYKGTRPTFRHGDYLSILEGHNADFDACMLMGNALSHHSHSYKDILKAVSKSLVQKNAVLVVQLTNYYRVLNNLNRIQYFKIVPSRIHPKTRYAFLEMFNEPDLKKKEILYTISVLSCTDKVWSQDSVNSTPLAYLDEKSIIPLLKKAGFKKVSVYGSKYYESPFTSAFDKKLHDWINVVAMR